MSYAIRSALMLSCAALTGCAVVGSGDHRDGQTTSAGLVYALPKGAMQLVAERKIVAADDVKKAKDAADAAAAALAVTTKALEDAQKQLDELQGRLTVAPEGAKKALEEAVALAQATVNYATVRRENDRSVAAAARERHEAIAQLLNKCAETATLSVLPNRPDQSARFVASVQHNFTRDDNVKISVANGMLTSSTAVATDQLPSILVSLAQAVGAANVDLSTSPPSFIQSMPEPQQPPESPPEKEQSCAPYTEHIVFDPSDSSDTTKKLTYLNSHAPGFVVEVGAVSSATLAEWQTLANGEENNPKTREARTKIANALEPVTIGEPACGRDCGGLYYRVPVAIETRIRGKAPNATTRAMAAIVVVPDSTATYLLPTRAGAFTTSKLAFSFKDGMPVDYSVEQPSELAAIAGIPVRVAKALLSIPAEIIQLRVNHDTQANALIAAQTGELNAQLELLKAQQALDDAREAAAADDAVVVP